MQSQTTSFFTVFSLALHTKMKTPLLQPDSVPPCLSFVCQSIFDVASIVISNPWGMYKPRLVWISAKCGWRTMTTNTLACQSIAILASKRPLRSIKLCTVSRNSADCGLSGASSMIVFGHKRLHQASTGSADQPHEVTTWSP